MVCPRHSQTGASPLWALPTPPSPNHWWFDFLLLPRSPDFEITVRVYDSGKVEAFPLPPPKISAK
jgi:hypothetical protein